MEQALYRFLFSQDDGFGIRSRLETLLGPETAQAFLLQLPAIRAVLETDLQAAIEGDPAAESREEIIACYPGFYATAIHRLAHSLWQLGVPRVPRIMAERCHSATGIDIHPAATLGSSFFIDHGTGVVIGETARIGNGVRLYQGVTLGAAQTGRALRGVRRHPTLEDGVTVYANATVLGGDTVIGQSSIIGAHVLIATSVPPNTLVTADTSGLRFRPLP